MSRLKSRPAMPTFQDLLNQQSTRMEGEVCQSPKGDEEKIPVAVERMLVADETVKVPLRWPDFETFIQVPATINWTKKLNSFEYEVGITCKGHYPYDTDCSMIWIMRKINDKYVPIRRLC